MVEKKSSKVDYDVGKRQKIEAMYHNEKAKTNLLYGNGSVKKDYYAFFEGLIGRVAGMKVLDLGCGDGWKSIDLVKNGGRVYGVDISIELLKRAVKNARQSVGEHPHFVQMTAENLAFSDNSFDLVIGSAILHHTEIELTIESIYKVLKKGGRAIFIEPLNENILLRLWRKITPWRRSPVEKPLCSKDLRYIARNFSYMNNRFFIFSSIISEGLLILFPRSRLLRSFDSLLSRVDDYILKGFPSLGRYCGVVVLDLRK